MDYVGPFTFNGIRFAIGSLSLLPLIGSEFLPPSDEGEVRVEAEMEIATRLDLVDEDDPLESGIDITAQPPGKKNQSVQLLSGGEKALTALSLLISLFRIKPSPFCILDEVDAPLDDANVERFADLVQAMTDHTQFVLITHNRRTMTRADLLYGVTMEEPGVSKVVSVRVED